MSAKKILILVIPMHTATTLKDLIIVLVTLDIMETDLIVKVGTLNEW